MWLRADVSQEDELMSREDCAVSACGLVWARVWVLQSSLPAAPNYILIYLPGVKRA